MRPSWLLLLAACDAGSHGKPHLLGRVSSLSVHDTLADVKRKVPELATEGVGQLEDGASLYRVFYTEGGRIETIAEFVPGKLGELDWGKGTSGQTGGGRQGQFFVAADTSYFVTEGRTPGEIMIGAEPYLPLDKIWGSGHDVRVFGLELLGRPLHDDVDALAKLGLEMKIEGDKANRASHLMSDAGEVEWSFEGDPVKTIRVHINKDIPANVPAMDERFVEKWGKPTFDHQLTFHVEPHHVIEYPDKEIVITE